MSMGMEILHLDRYLTVVFKRSGVPSQPDKSGNEDMTALLRREIGGDIFCVHRLDTATEGVMVYARTSQCAGRLSQALSAPDAGKIYLAVVSGSPGEGEMCDLLLHDRHLNKSFVVDKKRAGVKEAALEYKTIAENNSLSLVRVRLHTGRTHQIRVQFAHRGWPLAGDGKYGSRIKCPMALCCASLSFVHPYTGKMMNFMHLPNFSVHGFSVKEDDIAL